MFLAAAAFLATFYLTAWVELLLITATVYYPGESLILAVPTVAATIASVFAWRQSATTRRTLGRSVKVGRRAWGWYLATGTVLAVTRAALFVWVAQQQAYHHIYTRTNSFIVERLYPETIVVLIWRSLVAAGGTRYWVAWCSLFAVGSFVMATPMLIVSWLRAGVPIKRQQGALQGSTSHGSGER